MPKFETHQGTYEFYNWISRLLLSNIKKALEFLDSLLGFHFFAKLSADARTMT